MGRKWKNSKGKNVFVDKANERSLDNLRREFCSNDKKSNHYKKKKNRRKWDVFTHTG